MESSIKKLKKQLDELPEPKFELEEAREELGVAKRTLSMCEDLDGEKECPTCATKLDAAHISGMHNRLRR
jgi:DNA repair exonuclease SbcCD ATPase subunit